MDPFIAGSLITAGSSLLGGVLDRKAQKSIEGIQMADKIRTGAKFGLHPLAAIGAQTSGYQPVMAQALTSAGQAIQTGLAERSNSRAANQLQQKQERLIEEQILEARSRTALNLANAKRVVVGPGSPVDPYAMRTENALMAVRLENGDIVYVPNPDVYEISPTELAAGRGMLEGGRIVSKIPQGEAPPVMPANPKLGQVYRPGNGMEYVYTKRGWRPRKERQ